MSLIKGVIFAFGLCASINSIIACAQIDIYVTPNAHPLSNLSEFKKVPGTSITLTQALGLLKEASLRTVKGAPKEGITIHLAAGTYRLGQTLNIDASSSGSADHLVKIEGPQVGSAIISGGRIVDDFSPVTNPAILARLPEAARSQVQRSDLVKQGISDFGYRKRHGFGTHNTPTSLEVFYQNRPMTLARWPNQTFTKITSTPEGEKGLTFTVEGANLAAWKDETELMASGYWFFNWADTTTLVKSLDVADKKITLNEPALPFGMKIGQPIFFNNVIAELDQPGEWYLDKTQSTLYFWPPKPLHENDVEVSIIEKLLVIDGASYIHISGITFQNARGDAVTIKDGHHITIFSSTIRNIGNNAALVQGGADNGLTDMLIEDIGETGVVLDGGDRQTLTPANLYVERSTIRRFARISHTYNPGIMLSGVGNRAVGNTISDSPHNAIVFGGNDHLISQNEIYDVCKETSDSGAIYTGRDWSMRGTVISNNHIHDISPSTDTIAIYLDDQASGVSIRGNLFEKVNQGVFIGGGRDNLVEDNTFHNTAVPIHLDARGRNWQKTMVMGLLKERLESVPYKQSVYTNRYAHLANLLNDEPGYPKYNIARRNLVIGAGILRISKDAESGISIESLNIVPSSRKRATKNGN